MIAFRPDVRLSRVRMSDVLHGVFGGYTMNIRRCLATAGAFALPVLAFAEGESGSTPNYQTAVSQLTTLSGEVTNYVGAAVPIVGSIIAAVLAITLLFVGWKLIRRATNKA